MDICKRVKCAVDLGEDVANVPLILLPYLGGVIPVKKDGLNYSWKGQQLPEKYFYFNIYDIESISSNLKMSILHKEGLEDLAANEGTLSDFKRGHIVLDKDQPRCGEGVSIHNIDFERTWTPAAIYNYTVNTSESLRYPIKMIVIHKSPPSKILVKLTDSSIWVLKKITSAGTHLLQEYNGHTTKEVVMEEINNVTLEKYD